MLCLGGTGLLQERSGGLLQQRSGRLRDGRRLILADQMRSKKGAAVSNETQRNFEIPREPWILNCAAALTTRFTHTQQRKLAQPPDHPATLIE